MGRERRVGEGEEKDKGRGERERERGKRVLDREGKERG